VMTRAETRFRLSVKRTSSFKPAGRGGGGGQFSRLLAAEVCVSAIVMLDTPCSEVVSRVLDTHSNLQFPLHIPSRASPCAITFQLDSASRTVAHQTLSCHPRCGNLLFPQIISRKLIIIKVWCNHKCHLKSPSILRGIFSLQEICSVSVN